MHQFCSISWTERFHKVFIKIRTKFHLAPSIGHARARAKRFSSQPPFATLPGVTSGLQATGHVTSTVVRALSGKLFEQPPKGDTTATRGPPSLDRCLVWNCQKWQPGQRRGLGSGRVRPTLPPCSGWGQPKLFSRLSARSPDHRAEQDPPLCSQCARRTCELPSPAAREGLPRGT